MDKKFVQRNGAEWGLGNEAERLEALLPRPRGKPGAHLDFTGLGPVLSNAYCQ